MYKIKFELMNQNTPEINPEIPPDEFDMLPVNT